MADWGQGAEGAAGGAMTGAAIGSVIPGVGTAIGAGAGGILGGLAGLFGSNDTDQTKQMLLDYYRQIQGRGLPGAMPTATADGSAVRGQQQSLVDQLRAISMGMGPSLAQEQMKANTDRVGAQQASIAASGRGGPMASMQAANNSALAGAMNSQQAMQGRIQEENSARDQLGLNLHGMASDDNQMNQFNASQTNQMAVNNMLARLKAMGMNDDAALQVIGGLQKQNKPAMGDQLLAGGGGSLGMLLASKYGGTGKS